MAREDFAIVPGVDWFFWVPGLVDQSNTKKFKSSATIASGDIRYSRNGGAFTNPTTLPSVDPGSSVQVKLTLLAAETSTWVKGDQVTWAFVDQSGAEWADMGLAVKVGDATPSVAVASVAAGAITAAAIATDAIDADAIAADAIAEINVTVDTALADYDAPTRAELTSDIASLATFIDTEVAAILVDTGTDIPALIDALPTATEVWAAATRTLTSGGGASAADIWANATRTLTQTAAQVAASVTGSDLAIVRAVTFEATLTGLTIPATWSKIYFTAKRYRAVADSEAVVQIVVSSPAAPLTDGLLRINRTAGTLAHGSLVVDQALGTVGIVLADDASTLLVADAYVYDVKALLADGTSVLLTAANVSVGDAVTESIA